MFFAHLTPGPLTGVGDLGHRVECLKVADPGGSSCGRTQLIALIGALPHADALGKVALSVSLQSDRTAHVVNVPFRFVSLYEAVTPVKAV